MPAEGIFIEVREHPAPDGDPYKQGDDANGRQGEGVGGDQPLGCGHA